MPQLSGTPILIRQIDQVQRSAARWTVNNFCRQASVTGIIEKLGWRTLEQRRADARLCLFYKVVHGLVVATLPDHVQYSNMISRYSHSMTFRQVSASTNYYKYSFFPPSNSTVELPTRVSCNTAEP